MRAAEAAEAAAPRSGTGKRVPGFVVDVAFGDYQPVIVGDLACVGDEGAVVQPLEVEEIPLREAAREFGQQLAAEGGRSEPETRFLRVLEESGYEPVEDDDKGIRLRNCPFHSLVDGHRDLVCGTNLALAEGTVRGTGAAVTPHLDPQEGFCCVAFRPRP